MHRIKRLAVNAAPQQKPCSLIANLEYSEHVG